MRISEVLQVKGDDVITISPDATVAELVTLLNAQQHRRGRGERGQSSRSTGSCPSATSYAAWARASTRWPRRCATS